MDFEQAPQITFRNYFDNVIIKGCNFHLGQIIYRKIQKSGFQKLYGNDAKFSMEMKCFFALSYLSPDDIPKYFDEWCKNISPEANGVAQWFSENYIWGTSASPTKYQPSHWSTKDLIEDIPRTKNYADYSIVSANHVGFYNISNQLIKEMKYSIIGIDKLGTGAPVSAKKFYRKSTA